MLSANVKLAKCGCDCSKCPTYKENLTTLSAREKCSAGWSKHLGIKFSPEKLRACDGCSISDSERKTSYLNCRIRKCAMVNNIQNCAFCKAFPCDELLKVHSLQNISDIDDYTNMRKKNISVLDFEYFIEPYLGIKHLSELRKRISSNETRDFKKFNTKIIFTPLKTENKSIETIYNIITDVCIEKNIPFARMLTLEHLRGQIMKIIWTAALYGKHEISKNYLEVDSITFSTQKINCMENILKGYFIILNKYGINCEIIPQVAKGWLTPTGGLRKQGWVFRLSFSSKSGGNNTLKVLKNIAESLNQKYKTKAFRLFCKGELIPT